MYRIARLTVWLVYPYSPAKRRFTTILSLHTDKQRVDQLLNPLSQKYAVAKDEVILKHLNFETDEKYEIAIESLGTTYAKEDIASAKELTGEVVREYESILKSDSVGEAEKKVIKERVGQRVRELVGAVQENLKEDNQ